MNTCDWTGRRLLASVLAAASCGLAAAEPDSAASDLRLGGFGTFGLLHSNAPDGWGFRRDTTQRANSGGTRADIDSRLGLQANYRATPQIEVVGQAVIARRTPNAPVSDAVTLAFAAWRPNDDVMLRAGRLSTDYFLIPEYRNVGFAYPFVRPPVDHYGAVPYALDGADLTKVWRREDMVWKLRGVEGRSTIFGDGSGKIVLRPVHALVLSCDDSDGLLVKASVARLRLRVDTTAIQPLVAGLRQVAALPVPAVAAEANQLASAFDLNGQPVSYYSVGVALDRGPWLVSVEVSHAQPKAAAPSSSAWAMLGHRWGALTGYTVVSATRRQRHGGDLPQWEQALAPVIGPAAAAQTQQLAVIAFTGASTATANQQTTALGVRWDVDDRTALKLQWDRVHVAAYGGLLWLNRTGDAVRANVTSATLDIVF